MRVEILIATRDRPYELTMLLNSLRFQTFQDFDIVLVDESGGDIMKVKMLRDVLTRIKLEGHRVKYIKNDVIKGIYNMRNLCIKNAEHELLLRIDDDSVCDKDYIKKLYDLIYNKENIGGVGGIVPPFGAPMAIRDINKVKPIFNKIIFPGSEKDVPESSTIVKSGEKLPSEKSVIITDDGGYFYQPNAILESDHLRSSFMFRKSAAEEIGLHRPVGSVIGWREESVFTMMMKWKGYKLLTDTSAVCHHCHAQSGGARLPIEAYKAKQELNEHWFQRWALRQYKKRGKYGV